MARQEFTDEQLDEAGLTDEVESQKLKADQKLMSDAARDIQLVEFAYNFEEGKSEEEKQAAYDFLPPDVELLMVTEFMEDTKEHDFRCAVFKNKKTKEIIFANAGTRANAQDLLADLRLGVGRVPWKGRAARKTNEMVLASLGDDAANYKFHYTGHSLGAAMADIAATDMATQLRKQNIIPGKGQISTVSFDNPGTKDIAERAYTQNGYHKDLCNQDIEFNQINNRPNLVNTVNKQMGREHRIFVDDDRGLFRKTLDLIFKPISIALKITSKILEVAVKPLTYLLDKAAHGKGVGAYIASVTKALLLAPSKLVKVFSMGAMSLQVQSHLTHNFINVLNKGKGTIRVADSVNHSTKRGYSKDEIAENAVKTVSEQLKEQGSPKTAYEQMVSSAEEHLKSSDKPRKGRVDEVVVFDKKMKAAAMKAMGNAVTVTSAVSKAAKLFKRGRSNVKTVPQQAKASEAEVEAPPVTTKPPVTKEAKAAKAKEEKKAYKEQHAAKGERVSGKKAAKAVRAKRLAEKEKQQQAQEKAAKAAAQKAREEKIQAYMAEHPGVKRQSAKQAVRRAEQKAKKAAGVSSAGRG